MFFLIFSIFLLIISGFFVFLFIKTKKQNLNLEKSLLSEFNKLSDALLHFSYGDLKQNLPIEHNQLPEKISESLNAIKKNFNKISGDPLNRICYVGTDAWFEGIACARHLGQKLKAGGKIIIIVTSSLEALVMSQRHRSFVNTITKEFPDIEILETFEAHANMESARKYVAQKAPFIDGIYITGNSAVSGVTQGLIDADKTRDVCVICHDLDDTIVTAMRKGLVSGSVVSSTYAQGYDSVVHLFNHIVSGWKPFQPRLMQKLETVTVKEVSKYWDDVSHEPRRSASIHHSGVTPMLNEDKKLRLLVLCEDWNTTFTQIKSGIEKAKRELSNFGCEVVVKVINQMKKPQKQVIKEITRIVNIERQKGLDGITTFVGFSDLVQVLNNYAEKGIPITTFNSEPLTLRSMIDWVFISANQLKDFSLEYQKGFHEVSMLQQNVLDQLDIVVKRSNNQTQSVENGARNVEDLTSVIDKKALEETKQMQSVNQTAKIAQSLSQMVTVFDTQVQGLKNMGDHVKKSAQKTDSIREYSDKINSIIEIIDSITEQTNLLAFNAAVESTHAGEWGKGFKVISEEIRNLADKSVDSTSNISTVITEMRSAVSEGIEANSSMLEIVNQQVQQVSNAATQLASLSKELISSIESVHQIVTKNSEEFKGMHRSAIGINQVMSESTDISKENTDTICNINNEFTDMSTKFDEMSRKTDQLMELTMIMEGTVASFASSQMQNAK